MDCDALEVARQLSLKEHALLSSVRLQEFLKTRWVSGHAPNLEACAEFANATSYWLALQIVQEETSKGQLRAWQQVLAVGKFLLELQNYNSMLAVYLALKHAAVAAVQAQWRPKDVPKKAQKLWRELETAISPLNNFAAYRQEVSPSLPDCSMLTLFSGEDTASPNDPMLRGSSQRLAVCD